MVGHSCLWPAAAVRNADAIENALLVAAFALLAKWSCSYSNNRNSKVN